jgi:hypothetical protein
MRRGFEDREVAALARQVIADSQASLASSDYDYLVVFGHRRLL